MSLGGEIARTYVTIGARTEEFQQKSQSVSQKLGNMGTKFMKTGAIMTAGVTVPVVAGFKQILSSASDAEELYSKFNTVFGEYSDEVRGWADEHSDIWGRSSQDLQGYLAGSQSLLVGFGATRNEAKDLSKEIVTLAVDLASFNNLAEADAMKSLQSALMGNHEAAKALDVVINENTLSMAMLDLGYEGTFQSLSELEKINVRYHAVLMQSSDAVGDAERTAGSYANQVRRLQGDIKDMSAELGKHLLPIMTKVVEYFTKVIGKFSEMSPEGQKFILIILGIVAAIGPLLIIIGAVMKAVAILGAVFGAISAPVLIVIGVIVALIAILKHLWDTNEEFREGVIEIWGQIKEAAEEIWGAILETIEVVGEKITEFWSQHGEQIMAVLEPIWEQIKLTVETAIKLIKDIIKLILAIIRGDWEDAWEAIKSIGQTIWNFIKNTAINLFTAMSNAIKMIADAMKNAVIAIFTAWANRLRQIVENIRTSVVNLFNRLADNLRQIWDNIRNTAIQLWETIKNAVIERAQAMRDAVINTVKNAVDYIASLPSQAAAWGRGIIQGLINGVKNMGGALARAIKGVVDSAVQKVKDYLGLSSPSKLFEGFGRNIAEGMALGMQRGSDMVNRAAVNMTGQTVPAAAGPVSSSTKITLDMRGLFDGANINMNSEQDAEILARKIYQLASGRARSEGTIL